MQCQNITCDADKQAFHRYGEKHAVQVSGCMGIDNREAFHLGRMGIHLRHGQYGSRCLNQTVDANIAEDRAHDFMPVKGLSQGDGTVDR